MLKLVVLLVGILLPQCGKTEYYGSGEDDDDIDPFPNCGQTSSTKDPDDPEEAKYGRTLLDFFKLGKRIVGGRESDQGAWPWQVALLFNGKQFCAGSLINRNWVVTASHCFHDSYSSTNPKFWTATLGEHKLPEKEVFEQVKNIESITLHEKYKSMFLEGIFDTPPDYDIALVKLATPAELSGIVYPICLLRSGMSFKPGKKCFITGWGQTQFNGTQPEALNEAKVKIVGMKNCNKNLSYAGKIHGRALCAGFARGGVDSCQFDSGGPLSCAKYGQFYLTGMTSWGHECARPHKFGVYSNMAVMTPWVLETIRKATGNAVRPHENNYY